MSLQGAKVGARLGLLAIALFFGFVINTGLPRPVDLVLAPLMVWLAYLLVRLLVGILVAIGATAVNAVRRKRPLWSRQAWQCGLEAGSIIGAVAAGTQVFGGLGGGTFWVVVAVGVTLTVLPTLLGAAVGWGLQRGMRRPLSVALVTMLAIAYTGAIGLLTYQPKLDAPTGWASPEAIAPLTAASPAELGPHKVLALTYGSGTDKHRPEYGAKATLTTATVDTSGFFFPPAGWIQQVKNWYWGFDHRTLPLNARVWYPEGAGPFPLALIVHGNHRATDFSEEGYAYLGELMASRGFIFASVDENFLNGDILSDYQNAEMPVRAYLLLRHIGAFEQFTRTEGNPFYGKVDLNNIALLGHSRGGEAAALAAVMNGMEGNLGYKDPLNFQYGIKSVVALAPSDGAYKPGGRLAEPVDVNYLLFTGAHDTDTWAPFGVRQYNRARFTGEQGYRLKSAVYVQHVNHGELNSSWIRDRSYPADWYYNEGPLLPGEQIRTMVKTYISAFLEVTLHGDQTYLPLLRTPHAGAAWLPAVDYAVQFADSTVQPIADFDAATPKATVEGDLTAALEWLDLRKNIGRDTRGLKLVWNGVGTYAITLPDTVRADRNAGLAFALADGEPAGEGRAPLDLTVEVVDAAGQTARVPLSRYGFPPALPTHPITRFGWMDESLAKSGPIGPVLQTYEIPLAHMVKVNPAFQPEALRTLRFVTDRASSGTAVLDDIGLISVVP